MSEPTYLRVERPSDGVVLLTLDDPDRRNVMSAEMTALWARTIEELRTDTSVRAVVLTGAGTAFCSGGNPRWISSEPDAGVNHLRTRMMPFYRTWLSIHSLEVPTIAVINGPAIGAGLCLALACDLRWAAAGAKMGLPFVKLGMHAGMGATHLLPDIVGGAYARDLMLTGRLVAAEEAQQMALVTRVVEPASLLEEALQAATEIAGTAPVASRLTKIALRDGGPASLESAIQWEALAQPITLATADLQEGVTAAREKRPPVFHGA